MTEQGLGPNGKSFMWVMGIGPGWIYLQHPLSNWTKPESISKILELRPQEPLGEYVCDVVAAWNIVDRDFIIAERVVNKVVLNRNVFGAWRNLLSIASAIANWLSQ